MVPYKPMLDQIVQLSFVSKQTPDVKSFRFSLGGQRIDYQAGQFVRLTIPTVASDPRGPARLLSIASSPQEHFLMVATKISQTPFKQALAGQVPGTSVNISGPFGRFTLVDDLPAGRQVQTKLHVFLSGGIGITPVRSIIKDATERKLPHKIVLLYANQTPDDIVFKEDLDELASTNPNLTIIYTITRPQESRPKDDQPLAKKSQWQGRIGRIDKTLIKEYVKDLSRTIFYICGPPSMVEALNTLVKGMGVSEENIKTERFTGYQ